MASLNRFRTFYNTYKLLQSHPAAVSKLEVLANSPSSLRFLSTTSRLNGLEEFFDEEKNWSRKEIKVGRSWRKEELRLKSNTDIHKLWYVLLKERNMLLTMEHECKERFEIFPNPERMDKVEESMENLEAVVRERNRAYHMLETGETGERPVEVRKNIFGMDQDYEMTEHFEPEPEASTEPPVWVKDGRAVTEFRRKFKEQMTRERTKEKNRNFRHVIGLLNRFPNIDMEALKEQYPNVNLKIVKNSKKFKPQFWEKEPKL